MPVAMNKEEFVKQANKLHNFKYDYTKVVYVNSRTSVIITCPEHGEFEQIAGTHLRSSGCKKCRYTKNGLHFRKGKAKFIEQSRAIFGDVYLYDKVQDDVSNSSRVIITCPEHGDFEKRVSDHLRKKRGCNLCTKMNKDGSIVHLGRVSTNEHFIMKANVKHNFEYTYDKVVYINSKTKVTITCKEHGDFEQTPANHLSGFKCAKCSGTYRYKDTPDFIKKCKEVHGDKYSYDKTIYINGRGKVIITCPEHGDFEQLASKHVAGNGCLECSGKMALTTETFIKKAHEIHGDKYDYSLVKYKNLKTKVSIVCKEHGVFTQQPTHHLHEKNGCSKCSGCERSSTPEFIEKASKVHNGKYTYPKTNYVNAHKLVKVECSEHGEFKITPNAHLGGSGCPECSNHNQQFAYIHVIYDGELPIALKYGIEKVHGRRQKHQDNKCIYKVSSMLYYHFSTPKSCRSAEQECKRIFGKGVLTKNEMKDGYTETTNITNLYKIIAIYEKWGGVKQ